MGQTALKENPEIQKDDYHYKKIRDALLSYMEERGETVETIAYQIGQPPRLISRFLDNKQGPNENMLLIKGRIRNWLDHHKHSPLLKGPIFQTRVMKELWELLQICNGMGIMGMGTGPAGSGKTVTILKYKKQHGDPIVITCGITMKCVGAALEAVGKAFGIKLYGRQNSVYLQRIIECLQERPRLLIFDEAHFLGWEAYEALRQVWDGAQTGIVYIGQERLYNQMRGRKETYLFDQIFSRIAIKRRVGEDISKEDVRLIAESFYPDLDRKSLDFLHQKACGDGRFRTLTNILRLAERIGETEQKSINLTVLREACRFLMA